MRPWTREEDEYLLRHRGGRGVCARIGKALGRNEQLVRRRLARLTNHPELMGDEHAWPVPTDSWPEDQRFEDVSRSVLDAEIGLVRKPVGSLMGAG